MVATGDEVRRRRKRLVAAGPRGRSVALSGKQLTALREAMVARGWGDAELAEAADISKAAAWKALDGKPVTALILGRIAEAIEDSRANPAVVRLLAGEIE